MISILSRMFIKDSKEYKNPEVRRKYGVLCGAVGVFLNLVLFGIKLFAGFISGSVAISADAFNNLSDAGSSIIMMVGFKMSGHKPDPEHPFGHGRIEYVTGLIVSFLIILMGFELIKSGIEKILNPEPIVCNRLIIIILIVSIFIKIYMYFYNRGTSRKIESQAMMATAMDSFTDSIATSVVLIATVVAEYTGIQVDGWCGLLVSFFILYAGISSAKDTMGPLLGSKPEPEFVETIEKYAISHEEILGIHDLIVHDYGPGRMMISFHAEVPSNGDLVKLHDLIDCVERKLRDTLGCEAVIHMDPVAVDDELTNETKAKVKELVKEISPEITIHDFRMVPGPTHTNVIFDAVVPHNFKISDEEVKKEIESKITKLPGNYFAVVTIDKPFV